MRNSILDVAGDHVIPAAFVKAVHDAAAVHASGWKVSIEATGWPELPTKVLLEHPLSDGHEILFRPDDVDVIDVSSLEAHVSWAGREFAQIARAPACPHAKLLRSIRSLAQVFGWPPDQLAALGGVLFENGALTIEEYEWLREDMHDRT